MLPSGFSSARYCLHREAATTASKSSGRVARWRCVPNREKGHSSVATCGPRAWGTINCANISLLSPPPVSPRLLSLSSPPPPCPYRIHTLCRGGVVWLHQGVCPILPPPPGMPPGCLSHPHPPGMLAGCLSIPPPLPGDASRVFVPSFPVTPTPIVPSQPPPPPVMPKYALQPPPPAPPPVFNHWWYVAYPPHTRCPQPPMCDGQPSEGPDIHSTESSLNHLARSLSARFAVSCAH